MDTGQTEHCVRCDKPDTEVRLSKCPICFKKYCEECRYHFSGRDFCSQFCAEYFFFADPED